MWTVRAARGLSQRPGGQGMPLVPLGTSSLTAAPTTARSGVLVRARVSPSSALWLCLARAVVLVGGMHRRTSGPGGPSCPVPAAGHPPSSPRQPPPQPHWPPGQLEAGGPDVRLTRRDAILGTRLPRTPASWRCRWRPHPPQPASGSPKYLGPAVTPSSPPVPGPRPREVALFGRLSRWAEGSCGIRRNCRSGFSPVFSFQFMPLNGLQLLPRDRPRSFICHMAAGRGAGQHSWSKLKPTYSGLATPPACRADFHGPAKTVLSWQGRKETTAARKKPPVLVRDPCKLTHNELCAPHRRTAQPSCPASSVRPGAPAPLVTLRTGAPGTARGRGAACRVGGLPAQLHPCKMHRNDTKPDR